MGSIPIHPRQVLAFVNSQDGGHSRGIVVWDKIRGIKRLRACRVWEGQRVSRRAKRTWIHDAAVSQSVRECRRVSARRCQSGCQPGIPVTSDPYRTLRG